MKPYLLLTIVVTFFFACSKDSEQPTVASGYLQKWKLVETRGGRENMPPATGDQMAWQEYYIFNSDSTFIKTRLQKNVLENATGVFVHEKTNGDVYLKLTYTTGQDLISSCYSYEGMEYLGFQNNQLNNWSWSACDGLGLIYEQCDIQYQPF